MDDKKCFNAIKKCNDIGKKLADNSEYILANGCIISDGYSEDTSASGYAISIIDNKLINDLDALAYIPLLFNGDDFYNLSKEYDFDRFEIDDDYLYIIFKGLYADDKSFYTDFINVATEKGFDKSHIVTEIDCNFENDFDLYELYVNYKKTYEPKEIYKEFTFKAKILKKENDILINFNKIIDEINSSSNISYKDIENELYERIMESTKPVVLKFKDVDGSDVFRLRAMKSLFKTAVKSSKIEMRVLEYTKLSNIYFVLLYVTNKAFTTIIIYKAINY